MFQRSLCRSASIALFILLSVLVALEGSPAGAQEKTIRLLRAPVGAFQPLYVALERGYFKERGLVVEIAIGGGPDQNIAQAMAGQVEIVMTGAVPLVAAAANGVPVVAVLGAEAHDDPATTGLMVKVDSPIRTLADLKGKRIGLPGIASPQGLATLLALDGAGLTQKDVALVNLPFDAVVESAERGQVDATFPVGFFYTLAKARGFRELPDVIRPLEGTPAVLYATARQWAEENPNTLKAFNEAMLRAYADANSNQTLVRQVDRLQTRLPSNFIDTRPIVPFVGTFNRNVWYKMNVALARFGLIPRVPASNEYIWDGAPR
ncbi:ABC transporter substrate-binding protein [Agrobacterium rhizogenes]|uniref:Twin-arginine translocation pathway signal n=1 Tax=Rhizobium rhizogenes (strain K84 / ATCC BAA-868) TaxID=311403 RepID=B9JQB1_RHIR8|nr:ABC transporter substrate-binding protein [Rhizobium rhizogenes]ACM31330.1 Twin-arginine translocation pathway signal [Rhizobium rhizogenes K84]OCJ22072.1 twin-arginine translocation pathway signal protein [Agrobacterium sp. B131/95]OCJ24411.1 twin-arginine translocation pathway signal protein [Agrobacterium sp. B133/95]NTI46279.1 ABC transporter substrate-binding protein [Rhizobium rhizogenes]NTI52962.1 ABC transporter substrate-binding protein [Rhizobium rhizogenes]